MLVLLTIYQRLRRCLSVCLSCCWVSAYKLVRVFKNKPFFFFIIFFIFFFFLHIQVSFFFFFSFRGSTIFFFSKPCFFFFFPFPFSLWPLSKMSNLTGIFFLVRKESKGNEDDEHRCDARSANPARLCSPCLFFCHFSFRLKKMKRK